MAQQGVVYSYEPGQQGAPSQQHTVVNMGGQQAYKSPEKDYLGLSIFNMLCCCFCVDIAAIIKSCDVRSANERRDPQAKSHSQTALKLNKIGIGIGIGIHVIWIIIVILFFTVFAVGVNRLNNDIKDNWESYYTTPSFG